MAPAAAALSVHLRRRPLHGPDGEPLGQDLEVTDVAAAADGVDGTDDPIGGLTRGLVTLLVEYPLAELVGEGLAMVGLTPPLVAGELPLPFEPGAAVIRTGVGADGDPQALAALARLADQGHPLALDGIVNSATARPALAVVRYAVLDLPADPADDLRWADLAAVAAAARQHGVEPIGRGVLDPGTRRRCEGLGVELLLGPLPTAVRADGLRLEPRQASALQLLGELSDPLAEVEQIADVIKTDPGLSFEVLRVANSAAMGYPRTIAELRDAVMIVGMARLRAWVALVALSPTGRPSDALTCAVIQARMCELLTGRLHQGPPGVAFVVGLLDGVADALGLAVGDLLTALPKLSREVVDALAGEDPLLHGVLEAARGYRSADRAGVDAAGIGHREATHAYLDALVWSAQTTRAVTDRAAGDRRG